MPRPKKLIETIALRNVRPELNEDGSPGDIVRKGGTDHLNTDELEKYVQLGAVEVPVYKYVEPEAPKIEGDE